MASYKLGDNPKLAELLSRVSVVENSRPVTNAVADNLSETYAARYAKPKTDAEAIDKLVRIFKNLMGECPVEVKNGIGEYYRILANRQLPAFEWMAEAFHVASKKEEQKRNFRYVVGMLRSWMKFGFGHIPSQEEEEVVNYFEEVTGTRVTPQARLLIQYLMGTYGAIKVTQMIGKLEKECDVSMLMAQILKSYLENKYPELRYKFT